MLSIANSPRISALTIAGSVFGSCTVEAQAPIGKYFLPFFNALDVITVNCLMLFATTLKTRPRAHPRPVSGFLVFGKKCFGLISTKIFSSLISVRLKCASKNSTKIHSHQFSSIIASSFFITSSFSKPRRPIWINFLMFAVTLR